MTAELTPDVLDVKYHSFVHDTRNFLQCLHGRIDLLGMTHHHLTSDEDFRELKRDLKRMTLFLNEALAEENGPEKAFDVVLTAYDVVQKVTPTYMLCGKTITFDEGKHILALGKPVSFGRILDNILLNGARYASSKAEVRFDENDSLVRVIVSNDGPIISPRTASNLFTSSPPKFRNLHGYGLPSSRMLIEAMHGSIDYLVSENTGAFVCTLPKTLNH